MTREYLHLKAISLTQDQFGVVCVLKIGLLSAWGENKHPFLSAANKVHLSLKE